MELVGKEYNMSNPISFINSYSKNIVDFISILKDLETQNAMIFSDSTLVTRYFSTPNFPSGQPTIRTDITEAQVTAAKNAIVQLLFTFNSGSPTQASALYAMIP
jgi:hypothetical protein